MGSRRSKRLFILSGLCSFSDVQRLEFRHLSYEEHCAGALLGNHVEEWAVEEEVYGLVWVRYDSGVHLHSCYSRSFCTLFLYLDAASLLYRADGQLLATQVGKVSIKVDKGVFSSIDI